jgi:iron complex outermembrane receptor protein
LPGIEYYQFTDTPTESFSHELRLSSEERIAGIFDYVVGGFYNKETSHPTVNGVAQFLSGAFGRPGVPPTVQDPVDRYTLRTAITIDPVATEASVFGNITAHIGDNTELSAGGRYIEFKRRDKYTLGLQGGFFGLPAPVGGQCTGLVNSPVYVGQACDFPIASSTLQDVDRRSKFTPFVYNVSLSHKFTPDFMVYGNVGTAFRSAGPQIGITSLTSCCTQLGGPNLGTIDDLIFHGQEKSTSYEVGFKSTFLDRRARFNVSLFKQKFDNYFFLTQSVRYLGVTTNLASASVNSSEFTADVDAKVKGIDVEAGFQITPSWSVDLAFTWSKAELDNALVPCNDGNFDGTPDNIVPTTQAFINAGVLVARCRSNASISRSPRWNLSVQSEFTQPLSDRVDGFLRGNFVYYPDNPNSSEGVVIDKYSLLNAFAGIRSPDGEWEVSLFANNLLNTKQVLSINPVVPVSSGNVAGVFGRPAAGYQQIAYTPRREFGLQVRYAFGSR